MPYKDPEKRKEASRRHSRAHYERNMESRKAQALASKRKQRAMLRDAVNTYKASHPCRDCHVQYVPHVMEFDHVRGTKHANIADLVSGAVGLKTLLDEMDKCEVVCANCHRVRTQRRLICEKVEN